MNTKALQTQNQIPKPNLNENFSKHLEEIFGTLKEPTIPPIPNQQNENEGKLNDNFTKNLKNIFGDFENDDSADYSSFMLEDSQQQQSQSNQKISQQNNNQSNLDSEEQKQEEEQLHNQLEIAFNDDSDEINDSKLDGKSKIPYQSNIDKLRQSKDPIPQIGQYENQQQQNVQQDPSNQHNQASSSQDPFQENNLLNDKQNQSQNYSELLLTNNNDEENKTKFQPPEQYQTNNNADQYNNKVNSPELLLQNNKDGDEIDNRVDSSLNENDEEKQRGKLKEIFFSDMDDEPYDQEEESIQENVFIPQGDLKEQEPDKDHQESFQQETIKSLNLNPQQDEKKNNEKDLNQIDQFIEKDNRKSEQILQNKGSKQDLLDDRKQDVQPEPKPHIFNDPPPSNCSFIKYYELPQLFIKFESINEKQSRNNYPNDLGQITESNNENENKDNYLIAPPRKQSNSQSNLSNMESPDPQDDGQGLEEIEEEKEYSEKDFPLDDGKKFAKQIKFQVKQINPNKIKQSQ